MYNTVQHPYNKEIQGVDIKKATIKSLFELLCIFNCRTPEPQRCLMVGNDVSEDMEAAAQAGMQVYLLTDCLINRHDRDISACPQGGFDELRELLQA